MEAELVNRTDFTCLSVFKYDEARSGYFNFVYYSVFLGYLVRLHKLIQKQLVLCHINALVLEQN